MNPKRFMDAQLNIVLHPNQRKIHEAGTRFRAIKAGKRFGKSQWAIFEILKQAGRKPGGLFWYIAPTYGQAYEIAWPTIGWMLPKQWIKNKWESRLTLELINGAKIVLKGADNKDSLRGIELHGFVMDEAAYINGEIWPTILRGQLTDDGFAYFISSPHEKGRNWYTHFCEEAARKQKSGDPEWSYFHFTIYDNPTRLPKEIEATKQENSDYTWKLEYLAEESDLAGQIYSEFKESAHVKSLSRNPSLYHCRGIDWGISHPTVCLWAAFDISRTLSAQDNPVYIYDEYVVTGQVISEICRTIKDKSKDAQVQWSVIDPSTRKRNSQTPFTDADEFNRNGVHVIPGDNRDRGIDITKMMLKKDLVAISPRCRNLILELKNVQFGDKEGDDCTDTLRYLLTRIHDITGGMNLWPKEDEKKPERKPHEYNIYELFPKKPKSGDVSWALEAADADQESVA